ncbi:glycosyltransferase family 2 protein [Herbiconiux sp. P15]|uniref:glycosyltransferase family 2 protein n=1 Tax=Herbiconiux liukaitaii TaxID=3342799 RepID=UPI0035B7257C
MTGAPFRVTAVVVNWRQPELTSAAVRSLETQEGLEAARGRRGVDLSIVVVDNGSGDDSARVLAERHPQHRVLPVQVNGGFGAGVNAGIRAAGDDQDAFVLLNNDAAAGPLFVRSLVDALVEDPRAGAVTARIVLRDLYRRVPSGQPQGGDARGALVAADGTRWVPDASGEALLNSTGNEMTRSGNGRDRDWLVPVSLDSRAAGEAMGFSGGASALRAAALREVGLFDESLFMYYEDTDLSWRLRRAGWSIRYAPGATVQHAHAASSGTGSALFRFHNERNRILVAAKHAPLPVLLTALARTAFRRRLTSLAAAVRRLPAALGERRRLDREAVVPRSAVAALLVED